MRVLSLFDGMACGMLAMQKAGVEVDEYIAYEIDKYAVQTAVHNFPMIKECGDVFKADFTQYKDIDYIVGGSPCTYWSIAQKNNRETEASGLGWELFSQYVRALKEVKPKYFIYENNKSMSNAIRESITDTFGFEPICINSALVSAQNRQRLYWVGKRNDDGTYSKVNVKQPEDRGILLKDILESGIDLTTNDKSWTLTASYNGAVPWNTIERCQRNMVAEPVIFNTPHGYNKGGIKYDKSPTLTANGSWQSNNFISEPVSVTSDTQNGNETFISDNVEYHISEVAEPTAVNLQVVGRKKNDNGEYERSWEARTDGKASTITSVDSRRMVAEPVNITANGKSHTIKAQYYKNGIANFVTNGGHNASAVAEPVSEPIRVGSLPRPNGELSSSQAMRIYSVEGKSVNLTAGGGGMGGKTGLYAIPVEFDDDVPTKAVSCADGKTYTVYEVKNGLITIKGNKYSIKLADGYYIIRKLTVLECKRLQTVPEWYVFPVSDSQAYKMLGNGWTVDVIAHLIEATLRE